MRSPAQALRTCQLTLLIRSYFDEDVVTTSQYIWYVCARRRTTVLVQFGPAFNGLTQLLVVAFLPLGCAARREGGVRGVSPRQPPRLPASAVL